MPDERGPRVEPLPVRPARSLPIGRRAQVPAGKLEVVTTFLEMRSPPPPAGGHHRAEPLALIRANPPTVSYYRYLYEAVGSSWLWYERRLLDDAALAAIVEDPLVEVTVLYHRGSPAGYVELDTRVPGEVELAYLGLLPGHIGRGLGTYLLDWALGHAWDRGPERVWVHTCTLDHPAALATYQRAGFEPYDQQVALIDDPRRPGMMPPGRGF